MEKSNSNVGGMKLPIGYRFHPTDEELVLHYLRHKVFGAPLPASVIPELDVFQAPPSNLPGDMKEKRYFFSRKYGNDSENKMKKAASSGYWKPIGKGRPIIASFSNHIVGIRKTLLFREDKKHSNKESKTQWIMHEYHLIGSGINQVCKMRLGEWVIYSVFQKKRKPKKQSKSTRRTSEAMNNNSSFMEESLNNNGPHQSSSCSSEITEVSNNRLDQEEISSSSSIINFSFHSCNRKTT